MARAPKAATKPIPLPELPSRQFYTLGEAAAELNRVYGRTDVDENYILQLGSMGKIAVQWLFRRGEETLIIIPSPLLTSQEMMGLESFKVNIELQDACIKSVFFQTTFLEIDYHFLEYFYHVDKLENPGLIFRNISFNGSKPITINNLLEGHQFLEIVKDKLKFNTMDRGFFDKEGKHLKEYVSSDDSNEDVHILNIYNKNRLTDEAIEKKHFDIYKSDLYVLGAHIEEFKNGMFKNRNYIINEIDEYQAEKLAAMQHHKPKEFNSSKAASAIALISLHKDLDLSNHSTLATQLLNRLPAQLDYLIGESTLIDLLKDAKQCIEHIKETDADRYPDLNKPK